MEYRAPWKAVDAEDTLSSRAVLLPLARSRTALLPRCAFVAMLLVAAACGDAGLCENASHVEILSPDAELGAWVFIRGCGATTSSSVHVSILPAGSPEPDDVGNTFIVEQGGSVSVEWPAERELLVTHEPKGEVLKQEHEVAGVAVAYRTEYRP